MKGVNKIVGYILAAIGLVGMAVSTISQLKPLVPIIKDIPSLYIIIGSIFVIAIGAILITKSQKTKQPREVPIFQGDAIVGYRRH